MKKLMTTFLGIALATGLVIFSGCTSNNSLMNEVVALRAAAMSNAEDAYIGCLAPVEASKYKDNLGAIMQILGFCQSQAFYRGEESAKAGDSKDRVFLRSCFLSYIDMVAPPTDSQQKAEMLSFCEKSLDKVKAVKAKKETK